MDDVEIYEVASEEPEFTKGRQTNAPSSDSAKPTAGTTGAAEKSGDFPVVWIVVIVVAAVLAAGAVVFLILRGKAGKTR